MASQEGKKYGDVFKKYVGPAHDNMKETFKNAIANNENIVWDQTNLTRRKRASIINQVPNHYRIVGVVFEVPEDVRRQRQEGRTDKHIPDDIITNMANSYEPPQKSEGFDKIITIND